MHFAVSRELGAEAAFVSNCLSLGSSFARRPLCLSQPRRYIVPGLHRQVWAVLDKEPHTNISQVKASDHSDEQESSASSQHGEEILRDTASNFVQNFENAWYSVVERVGHDDTRGTVEVDEESNHSSVEAVVDLMKLDGMGRQVLTGSSYDQVVDVDIEEGGVLDDDEDNNDLHCGVELDALVESHILVENLRNDLGIETATHVQLAAIPRVLDGRDLVIQSHTGTGKTLAFLLPILDEIDETMGATQAMIIAPTRELAMQISRECDRLISGTEIRSLALIGGANPARQIEKLRKRQPHVVVGTPGRLAELLEQRELRVPCVRWLVVDEVDQCLGEVFLDHVVKLLTAVRRKQIILVSATGDVDRVRQFAVTYLHRPVLLRVGGAQRIPKRIQHYCCIVPARMKIGLVKKLMTTSPIPKRAIAFVDDPRRVDIVVEKLYRMGLVAGGLKGSAHKLERADVLTAIRKGRINLLVTTEVAARGLDVREITHVFNLDLPTDGDHYLHRAGRCGRAGEDGFVVSIASSDKGFVINRLAAELGIEIPRMEPRYGMYREPVVRARKDAVVATRRENNNFAPSDTGGKGHVIAKRQHETESAGSFDDSLVSLQDAVERSDTEFIENSFLQQVEIASGSEGKDSSEVRTRSKKTTGKLKGKAKVKAKAKAKEKAKAKSAERRARRKPEKAAETPYEQPATQELGEMSSSSHSSLSRSERRDYNRRQSDISHRAAAEGWVGNRVALKQEE